MDFFRFVSHDSDFENCCRFSSPRERAAATRRESIFSGGLHSSDKELIRCPIKDGTTRDESCQYNPIP